jgi:hypothetical protein
MYDQRAHDQYVSSKGPNKLWSDCSHMEIAFPTLGGALSTVSRIRAPSGQLYHTATAHKPCQQQQGDMQIKVLNLWL